MLKKLALALIAVYQKHISPRKGFSCGYRVHAGGASCSHFGKQAIAKHGVGLGLLLIRRRFAKCAWQVHEHAQQVAVVSRNRQLRGQGGFVDCDCGGGGCDLPSCDMPSCGKIDTCEVLDCGADAASTVWNCGQSGQARENARLRAAAQRRERRSEKQEQKKNPPQ